MIENRTILDTSDLDGFDKVNGLITGTRVLSMLFLLRFPHCVSFCYSFYNLSSGDLLTLLCR